MPDVQENTEGKASVANSATPDIASLMPDTNKSIADLTAATDTFKTAYKNAAGQRDAAAGQMERRQEQDRAEYLHAYKAEGVAASEQLKPWDADKEHKKWESNPIEGFGSVGGLFAMVASAFTKAPMENAINGMAGAITSIQEGNEKGYKRAYESYKENVKLAEQRFKMQHELYEDALSLGTHDLAVSQAKMSNAAARMGDPKMLYLIDTGHIKEVHELQASRLKSFDDAMELDGKITEHTFRKAAYDAIKKGFQPTGDKALDAVNIAAIVQNVKDGGKGYGPTEQVLVGKAVTEGLLKGENWQQIADRAIEIKERLTKGHEEEQRRQDFIEQRMQASRDANGGKEPSAEEQAKILSDAAALGKGGRGAAGAGNKPALTNERQIQADAEKHKSEMKTQHPDWSEKQLDDDRDKYVRDRKIDTTAPSATTLDTIRGKTDRVTNMETTIDHVEELMKKHNALTGLGGKITRPAEVVGNIFGSNATDRKQFERYVSELQEWAPNALNDRNGRPLSSEAAKIQTIIAGLNLGDTTANTARAYTELRTLLKTIKTQLQSRGEGTSSGTSAAPAKEEKPEAQPWLNDPVKP